MLQQAGITPGSLVEDTKAGSGGYLPLSVLLGNDLLVPCGELAVGPIPWDSSLVFIMSLSAELLPDGWAATH